LIAPITKKLLVAYDESKPAAEKGDFLVIIFEGTDPVFFGLKSRRTCKSGRMVFVGKEIRPEDIFAKLIDSGRKIENVDQTLKNITSYIRQLENFKIGNVVAIAAKNNDLGFELVKVAEMPKVETK
jgi:hypothetical protein